MPTVTEIAAIIQDVPNRLTQQLGQYGRPADQTLSNFVGTAPPLSAQDFKLYSELVASRVSRLTKVQLDLDGFGPWLGNFAPKLASLQFSSLNQGHATQYLNALAMLQMIDAAIPPIPPKEPKVDWEDLKDQKSLLPKDLATRLRSVEARISTFEPRSKELGKKIADIENAHATADQLPTDLAELAERREELSKLIAEARDLAESIRVSSDEVETSTASLQKNIKVSEDAITATSARAQGVLEKSEKALRGATSVGLAQAFETRRAALAKASKWWTAGLASALVVALLIGWERVNALQAVLTGQSSATSIIVNALLALIGVGAPVWFAWLSTKQIGTTFRLSEDYAFKASVSQAYEGYRTEALEID